ncbi:hypothetical protein D3H34_29220, partial [Acidovorax cavernicola]
MCALYLRAFRRKPWSSATAVIYSFKERDRFHENEIPAGLGDPGHIGGLRWRWWRWRIPRLA